MEEVREFFQLSNPLFLDASVSTVLYIVCRLLSKRLPRISEGIREASLLFLVFMCYDASRYFALDEESEAVANARKVIAFEKKVHIDYEIPLQKLVISHLEFAKFLNSFYLGAHWGGLVIFFVWAFGRVVFASPSKINRRRKEYVQARGRFIFMNMIAACSFILYPCAPPRAIPNGGYVDTLASISHTDVYTNTRRWVNPYAAMPSMHQGYSLLFSITIVIMLRSEILASAVETEGEEENGLEEKKLDTTGMRTMLSHVLYRYNQYHVLSHTTRKNASKLFYLSLIPFVFLAYPVFMFLVIVGTGNHFVLDAIAGALAMVLATLAYPLMHRAMEWVVSNMLPKPHVKPTILSACVTGDTIDIEMGNVEGKEGEEKMSFLAKETA